MESAVTIGLQWIAIAFLLLMLYFALFERGLPYRVGRPPADPLDSEAFRLTLSALAGGALHPANKVEVLANGEAFYEAELQAIREARDSVHLEAYIFQRGEVTRRFLEAMAERAQAGVAVRVVLDAVGCFLTTPGYMAPLLEAGGHVGFYHPIRWHNLPRINNRTHRELLIVDGKVGFLGGAGFADHWLRPHGLAAYDTALAARLEEDFARDLAQSRRVNYATWRRRPLTERGHELLGWLLERQQ